MTDYYFVGTYLADLEFGKEPEISFAEFETLLKDNLTPKDYQHVHVLRLLIDIENLRFFWKEKELDKRGNFNEQELDQAILSRGVLPIWLDDFLDEFESTEAKLKNFSRIWAAFFKHEIPKNKSFLKSYLNFEYELRLVLTAYRAKKLGRDIVKELQFEDLEHPLVQQILAEKDVKSYTLPSEYEELAQILQVSGDEPDLLAPALDAYRFKKIEEIEGLETFSLDRLLAYMAQLFLIEKNVAPHAETGEELVLKIINAKDLIR